VLLRHDFVSGRRTSIDTQTAIGEPVFVPSDGAGDVLDGFYATFGTSLDDGRSGFYLWDAADPGPEPRAWVLLPQRVPTGRHANWFPAERPTGV
jgi:carotenoid cleavage dioxygenase